MYKNKNSKYKYLYYDSWGSSNYDYNRNTYNQASDKQKEMMEKFKIQFLKNKSKFVADENTAITDTDSKDKFFPGRDGIYLRSNYDINNNQITVVTKVDACLLLSSPKTGIVDFKINNKIPKRIIEEIIGSFNLVYAKTGFEAAAQVYRKRDTGEYFVYYPEQTISGAQVSYPDDPNLSEMRSKYDLVCELHSHNSMAAFWSITDDANEKELGFYVVIGTFNTDCTYKARVKCNNAQKDLALSDLFDLTEAEEKDILKKENRSKGNEEILTKIKVSPTLSYKTIPIYTTSTTTPINYAPRVVHTNISDDIHTLEIITITKNIVEELADEYKFSADMDTVNTRYLNTVNITDIKDDLHAYDFSLYTGGYGYPYGIDLYQELANEDLRTNAFLLKLYSTASVYDLMPDVDETYDLYDEEKFIKLAYTLDSSSLTAVEWNLVVFWECLDKYQKALIANAFDQNIILFSQFIHEKETTNYYFMKLLQTIIVASEDRLDMIKQYLKKVEQNYTPTDEIDDGYENITLIEQYFDNLLNEDLTINKIQKIADITTIATDDNISTIKDNTSVNTTEEQLELFKNGVAI